MNDYICVRCGVRYAAAVRPPACCTICEDECEAVYWTVPQVVSSCAA